MLARGVNILEPADAYDESEILLEGRNRGLAGDPTMTFREVTPDEVLAALGDGGEDSVLRACVAALRAHPRPSYAIGGSPADAVRDTLEVKYRRAASRGKDLNRRQRVATAAPGTRQRAGGWGVRASRRQELHHLCDPFNAEARGSRDHVRRAARRGGK